MKILHILSSDCFSGAENVVCQIIDMMREDLEFEMVYCSPDGPIRETLAEKNIVYVPIRAVTVAEIKRVLRELRPDRIHAQDMRASVMAAAACGKLPLISHIHNNNLESSRLSIRSAAYFFAALKAKHIFWVSSSACEDYIFHKVFLRKSEILQNILNVERLYQTMEQDQNSYPYDLVYVGRLTYPKNPQRLLRVLAGVVSQEPSVRAAIVGSGEMEEEIRQLAENLHLGKNVDFLGFRKNPLKIMHDAKVMLMTSRWEGTPMCVLEAMALGLPLVCTPTDGINELIENDKNGYTSQDDDVLVKKILEIIRDENLHSRLSEYTKQKSESINRPENYKERLSSVYKEI